MILVVASEKDIASLNIKRQILNEYPSKQTQKTHQSNPIYQVELDGKHVTLVTLKEESVNAQSLPQSFPDTDLIIFISRHSSQSGKPTLSVHTPGNFGKAGLGGLPRTLSIAPAHAMQTALKELQRQKEAKGLEYDVSYEGTHHGPSLNVPAMFVELGSSEPQWHDEKAAQVVADSAMQAAANFSGKAGSAVLGIGGPHYNEKFTRMALRGETPFGHMIPKYAVPFIDSEIITQCLERTLEKVSLAVLDWKGIASQDKPKIQSVLSDLKLPFEKV